MADYNLQANEVSLLKETGVSSSGEVRGSGDLLLTNLNLVFIQKSTFLNRTLGVYANPLSDIKVYNGEPQIRITDGELEIQFLDGVERFNIGNSVMTGNWARFMRMTRNGEVVTPQDIEAGEARVEAYRDKENSKTEAIPGATFLAKKIKGTVDVFSDTFGRKKIDDQGPTEILTIKCENCGASVTGARGKTVTCAYCGNAQVIR